MYIYNFGIKRSHKRIENISIFTFLNPGGGFFDRLKDLNRYL